VVFQERAINRFSTLEENPHDLPPLNFIEIFAKIEVLLEKADANDRRGIRETETRP
jgi:hypothetical protein